MKLVPVRAEDEKQRERLLLETVVPRWVQRCGADCARAWNQTMAPALGIRAKAE